MPTGNSSARLVGIDHLDPARVAAEAVDVASVKPHVGQHAIDRAGQLGSMNGGIAGANTMPGRILDPPAMMPTYRATSAHPRRRWSRFRLLPPARRPCRAVSENGGGDDRCRIIAVETVAIEQVSM